MNKTPKNGILPKVLVSVIRKGKVWVYFQIGCNIYAAQKSGRSAHGVYGNCLETAWRFGRHNIICRRMNKRLQPFVVQGQRVGIDCAQKICHGGAVPCLTQSYCQETQQINCPISAAGRKKRELIIPFGALQAGNAVGPPHVHHTLAVVHRK